MTEEQQEIYDEGYDAYQSGDAEDWNPYTDLNAEFWSDGFADAKEDDTQ